MYESESRSRLDAVISCYAQVNSEVIIDISMALLKNPSLEIKFDVPQDFERSIRETLEFLDPDGCLAEGCHQNTAIHQDYEIDNKCRDTIPETWMTYQDLYEGAKSMPPKDLIICPCMVFGYVLRSRKWASLDIQLVEDIAVLESGFESLVLPKGHAETLLALVETHSKGAKATTRQKFMERQVDLVRGKGKGLIILLHGEPGVGKTSTAECVAGTSPRTNFFVFIVHVLARAFKRANIYLRGLRTSCRIRRWSANFRVFARIHATPFVSGDLRRLRLQCRGS